MNYLKKIIQLVNPSPPIAGLEISDFYVRFFYSRSDKFINLEVRLTPGVVQEGKVVDKEKLTEALGKLRAKLGKSAKKLPHVIVTVHSASVYLQTFNLPYLAPDKVDEAARLNIQMISPIPFEEAYVDWDMLGEDLSTGQIKFIGAFTEKKNIDAVIEVCRAVDFVVVAVEPSILALQRAVSGSLPEKGKEDLVLLLHVSNEGMDFAGMRRGKIQFDYFVSWLSMYEGASEIAPQVFEDTVARYTQQVLNFALSHAGASVKEMVLVASEFRDEIRAIIEKNFNLTVTPLDTFADGKFDALWGVAYGAYIRGQISRSEDALISLTSVGTEEEFRQSQILLSIKLWRNIVAAFGATLLLIFAITFLFLQNVERDFRGETVQRLGATEREELGGLIAIATEFNNTLAVVRTTREQSLVVHPHLKAIERARSSSITFSSIALQSRGAPITIVGTGENNRAVQDFKRALEADPVFASVDLPLASITPASGGRFSFSMRVTVTP